MRLVDRPSPNFNDRPDGPPIDMLILHYTGMRTAEEALDRLCDPEAKVSAHYTVDEDGTCYRHVPEEKRAWHAGVSFWAGERDVNGRSVGIEMVNPGHEFGYRPFPEVQTAAVIELCHRILAAHPIPPHRVLGHSDVAPARKTDPGELFDWQWLAREGIGLWPDATGGGAERPPMAPGARGPEVFDLQAALAGFGYEIEGTGAYDPQTTTVVTAFQRHFRPSRIDGITDPETTERLHALLIMI